MIGLTPETFFGLRLWCGQNIEDLKKCLYGAIKGTKNATLLKIKRWFFSHWDNVCKHYNYSGCGANENSFLSQVIQQGLYSDFEIYDLCFQSECEVKCPPLEYTDSENR